MAKALETAWTVTKVAAAAVFGLFVYRCTQHIDRPGGALETMTAAATTTAKAKACDSSSFKVSDAKFNKREHSRLLRFTASVTNNGNEPCGVELKIVTFDKTGAALRSGDFWPAGMRNIPAGGTEHFSHHVEYEKTASDYQLQVLSAHQWPAR